MNNPNQQYTKEIDCVKKHGDLNNSMQLMEQKFDNQDKKLNAICKKLDNLDEKLEKRFAKIWVQRVVEGILIIFALASLYFIFISVGLPTP